MRRSLRAHGFTLIELMVAIAIIGLLVAAGTASLLNAQVNSRDSKRISDLSTISRALDSYILANRNQLPVVYAAQCSAIFAGQLQAYLPNSNAFPSDPKPAVANGVSCNDFTNGYMYYAFQPGLPPGPNPATTLQDRYVLITGLEKAPSPEVTSVLPTPNTFLNIGSSTIRFPYYLPGQYCGASGTQPSSC